MEKKSTCDVFDIISLFNFISKLFGFFVIKPDVSFFRRLIRDFFLFWFILLSTGCSIRSELWCIFILKVNFSEKRLILFLITQIIVSSTFTCLLCHRWNNIKIWRIITKIIILEKNLKSYEVKLKTVLLGFYGLVFFIFQVFMILGMVYYMVSYYPLDIVIDSTCVLYFEIWVLIPYFQFIGWIYFLNYVLCRVQSRIICLSGRDSLTPLDCFISKKKVNKKQYDLVKVKRSVNIMKQVLNISTELASAYGITVLLFVFNYLARIIAQFYDLIEKDSQRFPLWVGIWNVLVRVASILPVFACCESFTKNVNGTVRAIEEMVLFHHPSCLNKVFQNLTLRLRHKNSTIRLCGFLDITYMSFLTMMTASVAFLVLQLQMS